MTPSPITAATAQDRPQVLRSIVAAFVDDPVLRYLFPDPAGYPVQAEAFFGALFDRRVRRSTVWTVEGGVSAALWDPPADPSSDGPPPAVPDADPLAWLPDDVRARMREYDEAVHAAMPTARHWYLGVLATHPDHAGRGLGRALVRAGLERADADGLPAVLETSTSRNVGLYAGWGFEVREHLTRPLPVWIMERPSR